MSRPRAALVIPAFNSAHTIAATLESVQRQAGDLEQLGGAHLADDASTDSTITIAREAWTHRLPLTTWTSDRNQGERANVNRVLTKLQPDVDWILLLHADDLAKPSWLTTMTDRMALATPATASISSSYDNLLPDGSLVTGEDNPTRPVEIVEGRPESVRATLLSGCWWHISGCAIRLRPFLELGGFREHLPQTGDWEFVLRALSRGCTIEYIPRTLTDYRQHAASVSAQSFGRDRDLREALEIFRTYRRFLGRRDLATLHGQRAVTCLRRATRGAINAQPARSATALRSLFGVFASWVRLSARS